MDNVRRMTIALAATISFVLGALWSGLICRLVRRQSQLRAELQRRSAFQRSSGRSSTLPFALERASLWRRVARVVELSAAIASLAGLGLSLHLWFGYSAHNGTSPTGDGQLAGAENAEVAPIRENSSASNYGLPTERQESGLGVVRVVADDIRVGEAVGSILFDKTDVLAREPILLDSDSPAGSSEAEGGQRRDGTSSYVPMESGYVVASSSLRTLTSKGANVAGVGLTMEVKYIDLSDGTTLFRSFNTHTGQGISEDGALRQAAARCLREILEYLGSRSLQQA